MELHSVELEKKLRLPDPTKAMEGVWKLLRRTRQQLNMNPDQALGVSGSSSETLVAKKLAKIEAERQKARGAQYASRITFR